MTLDGAIKHLEEVAEINQKVVDTRIVFDDVTIDLLYCDDTEVIEEQLAIYQKRADEHRQLAEWLKDYKRLLEQQPTDETIKYLECNDIDVQEFVEVMKRQPLQLVNNIQPCEDCVSRAEVDKLINLYLRTPTIDDSIVFYEHFLDLPSVVPTQNWIPISEEMPKEGETVLVCYRTQEGISQSVCEWFDMPNRGIVWSTLCGSTPIAWQPLPKAYGEK